MPLQRVNRALAQHRARACADRRVAPAPPLRRCRDVSRHGGDATWRRVVAAAATRPGFKDDPCRRRGCCSCGGGFDSRAGRRSSPRRARPRRRRACARRSGASSSRRGSARGSAGSASGGASDRGHGGAAARFGIQAIGRGPAGHRRRARDASPRSPTAAPCEPAPVPHVPRRRGLGLSLRGRRRNATHRGTSSSRTHVGLSLRAPVPGPGEHRRARRERRGAAHTPWPPTNFEAGVGVPRRA